MSWLKAGVSSKQFWNSDTRAKMYKPSLALDMATTRRLTSLWSDRREKKKLKIGLTQGGEKKSKRSGRGGEESVKLRRNHVGAKTKSEEKGSKWKDQVKIVKEGEWQCGRRGLAKDKQQ